MRDQPLLQAFKVEVFAVSQQLCAVFLRADLHGIPAEEVDNLCEYGARAVRDFGGDDGRWAQQRVPREAGEDFCGVGEEDGEAEREVVWAVTGGVEEVAVDLEVRGADGDVNFRFEELRDEFRHCGC